jgi:hypothetical protein
LNASSAAIESGAHPFRFAGLPLNAWSFALRTWIAMIVLAPLVITGLFNGARDLFVLAFAGWMAVCVYTASLLDGGRAYGAVLSGYTVAIVERDTDAGLRCGSGGAISFLRHGLTRANRRAASKPTSFLAFSGAWLHPAPIRMLAPP